MGYGVWTGERMARLFELRNLRDQRELSAVERKELEYHTYGHTNHLLKLPLAGQTIGVDNGLSWGYRQDETDPGGTKQEA